MVEHDQDQPAEQEPTDANASTTATAASKPAATDDCPKCQEYLAGWKRAQADYQNLLRDSEHRQLDTIKFANERLLRELLPTIDQFALAMQHLPDVSRLPDDQRLIWDNWLVGIRAVQSLWQQMATGLGLTPIPTDGAFDPRLHDAVAEESVEGVAGGSIVKALQAGWRWHDKVLRPAKVVIAK